MTEAQKNYFVDMVFDNINIIHKICNIYSDGSNREDLKQEIIYQLWKSYPKFSAQSKFQTWMYRVALNTALLSFRKKKLIYTELTTEELKVSDADRENADVKSKINELYRHIGTLNDLDKAVTFLYIEKFSYKEISEIMGISEKNVSVKLVRIKNRLRELFNSSNH